MEPILESPGFLAPNNVELDSNKDAARWKAGGLKGPFSAVMVFQLCHEFRNFTHIIIIYFVCRVECI